MMRVRGARNVKEATVERTAFDRKWMARIDPITKGVWLLSTGLAVTLTLSVFGQAIWLLSVLLIALTGAGWTSRQWKMLGLWALGFAVPIFLFQWLVLPGETALQLAPAGQLLTLEALQVSSALTLRMMTLFASSCVYATTTEPRDVVVALVGRLRVPERLAYAAAIALRFVPLLIGEAEEIRHAQRLRRLAPVHGVGPRLKAALQLLPAIAQAALRHVHGIAAAMEAKRFGMAGTRTMWRQLRIMPLGIGLAAASVAAATASLCLF